MIPSAVFATGHKQLSFVNDAAFRNITEQMHLQKQKAIAALDLAAKSATQSACELTQAKDTIASLESELQSARVQSAVAADDEPNLFAAPEQYVASQLIAGLHKEIASLKAEMEAMKVSNSAIVSELRLELNAARSSWSAAERQLQLIRRSFALAQEAIVGSLGHLNNAILPSRPVPTSSTDDKVADEDALGNIPSSSISTVTVGGETQPITVDAAGSPAHHCNADATHQINSLATVSDVDRVQKRLRTSLRSTLEKAELIECLTGDLDANIVNRIKDAINEKMISIHDVIDAIVDSVRKTDDIRNGADAAERRARCIAAILSAISDHGLLENTLVRLSDIISSASNTTTKFIRAMVTLYCVICRNVSKIDHARVLLFDLMRLRPCLKIDLIAIVFRIVPAVVDVKCSSALAQAMRVVVCDALHVLPNSHTLKSDILIDPSWSQAYQSHDPKHFSAIASLAVVQIVHFDRTLFTDGKRALELISLSQGWSWSCAFIISPIWERILSSSDTETLCKLISTVGVVSRCSHSDTFTAKDGMAFLQSIITRLLAFLDPRFPAKVQIAAADALTVLANGRLPEVRNVYKWFISAPESIRSIIPPLLREDIFFIGRQIASR